MTDPLLVRIDVTSTLRSGWRAGTQRVVSRVVRELMADDRLRVEPVVLVEPLRLHRHLTPAELEQLVSEVVDHAVAGPPPERSPSRQRVAGTIDAVGLRPAARRVRRRIEANKVGQAERSLLVRDWPAGSVVLELDAVWNVDHFDRSRWYRMLADHGVVLVGWVNDLFPLTRPEWFTPDLARVFTRHADHLLGAASLTLAISQFTADEVDRRRPDAPATVVVPLGAELPAVVASAEPPLTPVPDGPFLLVVGTVEPRKNLGLALDVFDRLSATRPDLSLVVVGRAGWSADDVVSRLERHPLAGSRLQWLQGVGDATLEALYRSATVALVPSWAEGYGLPLVEAMARRTPVVASTGGALPEVAAGFVPVVDPDDVDGWTGAVDALLDPPARAAAVDRLGGFVPPTWSDCADVVADALLSTRS